MKNSYLVIADPETALGFECAGIPGVTAATAAEALAALRQARAKEVGIVILTEEVADLVRAEVEELRLGETLPMVVEIPGARGPIPGRRTLSDVIREAIGVKV